MTRCEDYPCCGHNLDTNPCDPRNEITEPWYCDMCGVEHYGSCPGDDYEDEEDE